MECVIAMYNFGKLVTKQNMAGSAAGSENRPLHYLCLIDCSTFSSYSVYSSGEAPSVVGRHGPL